MGGMILEGMTAVVISEGMTVVVLGGTTARMTLAVVVAEMTAGTIAEMIGKMNDGMKDVPILFGKMNGVAAGVGSKKNAQKIFAARKSGARKTKIVNAARKSAFARKRKIMKKT